VARGLAAGGARVAVVDADVGQSEIGPPTTIGLGRATPDLRRLADAPLLAMHFAGTTSPARDMTAVLVGAARMVQRARAEAFDHVLVDTSGLVTGELGRALTQAMIDLLEPDLVIALARPGVLAPVLSPYRGRARPAVLELPALACPRRRSPEQRRRFRADALARALAHAVPVRLAHRGPSGVPGRVVLRQPPLFAGEPLGDAGRAAAERAAGRRIAFAERRADGVITVVAESRLTVPQRHAIAAALREPVVDHGLDEIEGMIAGLEDAGGRLLGLGVVRAIDFTGAAMTVDTAVPLAAIAVVTVGRARGESG
jgi:polynucleotide 5'-hydroxyl-kinase GRC3/NOL9